MIIQKISEETMADFYISTYEQNTSSFFGHIFLILQRSYRAWYGLGQTYEILKMPFYSLYYYRKAHQLR